MSIWVKPFVGAFVCVGLLSGCDATSLLAKTSFARPTNSGNITMDLGSSAKQYRNVDEDGDGYAFKVGATNKDLVAVSGVIPGSDPGPEVKEGNATYYGTYVLGGYSDVEIKGTKFKPKPMADAGTIVLKADFDKQTIKGIGTALSAEDAKAVFDDDVKTDLLQGATLKVDGKIGGAEISGKVVYNGVGGTLEGVVGEDQAIGAFHGKGQGTVFAGGFSTETDVTKVSDTFCVLNPCGGLAGP